MQVGFVEDEVMLSVPINGEIRTTRSELSFYSNVAEDLITVKLFTRTDLGSIPRWIQPIFPKDGKAMFAYILHDYLYQRTSYSRKVCDEILKEALLSLGVPKQKSFLIYLGVRAFGDIKDRKPFA